MLQTPSSMLKSRPKRLPSRALPKSQAVSTPEKVATEAMLRSISAQRRTKVTPQAARATGPIWLTTFCRFRVVRKTSVTRLKKMNIAASVVSGATIRACRLAKRSA